MTTTQVLRFSGSGGEAVRVVVVVKGDGGVSKSHRFLQLLQI